MYFTISALNIKQIQTERYAAKAFDISRATLHRRRASCPARRDCQPNSRKLTQREEEVIVSYILHLDQRGFAPTYAAARDMADKLLAARGAGQVRTQVPVRQPRVRCLRPSGISLFHSDQKLQPCKLERRSPTHECTCQRRHRSL